MLIEPALLKRCADETVDPETLMGGRNAFKVNAGLELNNLGIPLNVTFSECCPIANNPQNLEEQLDQRRMLSEFCFEKLRANSVSFVK
jgi:hypothetical protein